LGVYRDIPEELRVLIEPVLREHDLELIDLDLVKGRAPWLVRLTVDTPACDGRVTVDRCAGVSREVGTQLEVSDAIPVSYRLEVSSPGLDRRLGREKDFAKACGSEVQIETRRPLDGRRRFRGRLLGFENGVARVTVDGSEVEIPFAEVAKANTVYPFTPSDFGRGVDR
jgi:ribosome maturation factor RimP